jgi:murein DD-endopeptidase MepM/ murein hydrolase activator NlpD
MADNDPNGEGGIYGSENNSGLGDSYSYNGGSEASAGGGTSYGESSETGVIETPMETPRDTPGGGDIAPQTESTGYSYSITPDGQLVRQYPSGSEIYGWTPDGRDIVRQSDGSLVELHFGDEHGRMRSTPYYEVNPARYARTAMPDLSMASFLENVRFYSRNIPQEYKAYSAARESREVDREIAAFGLGPDPVARTPGVTTPASAPGPAATSSLMSTPSMEKAYTPEVPSKPGDSGFTDKLNTAWNTATNFTGKAIDSVSNDARKAFDAAKDGAMDAAKGVGETGSNAVDSVKDGSGKAADAVGEVAGQVGNFLVSPVAAAVNPVNPPASPEEKPVEGTPPSGNEQPKPSQGQDDPPLPLTKQIDIKKQDVRDSAGKVTPEELEKKRQELQDLMVKNGTATVWPGNNTKINSNYGFREDPNNPGVITFHHGLDIKNEVDAPVLASDSGTVTNVEPTSGGETRVEITHRDGSKSTYLHTGQPTPTPYVTKGDYVIAGDTIGITDKSGHSTGGHIHYEYRTPDGTRVDPMTHLTKN